VSIEWFRLLLIAASERRTYGAFPDFLWTLVALANFMRLSLLKAGRALVGWSRVQEIRVAHFLVTAHLVTGPITTICKNGLIASIPSLYVSLTDKGDKAGVHPYNRILARA
jgi:hypothetical protein